MTNNNLEKIIFWLKPNGKDFDNGRMEVEGYCLKARYETRFGELKCKYLSLNYDNLTKSRCNYVRK